MNTTKLVVSALPPLLLLYSAAAPADTERGRLLYENHCRSCHESNVHIRQTQAAKSLKALRAGVVRWQEALALQWRSEDVGDVVGYLNATWYHYARVTHPARRDGRLLAAMRSGDPHPLLSAAGRARRSGRLPKRSDL